MSNWCPNCGKGVEGREKFCRQCGMNLNLSGEEASTWILSQPTSSNLDPPRPTKQVGQGPTAPNAPQTGPAYVPPVNYYPAPQPPQYHSPAHANTSSISLGDWLSGGWRVYRENWLLMSVASFIAMILSASTLGIMAGPLLMGLYGMAFKTMRGERPEMGDLFDFKGRFLQAFLAALIFFLIHVGFTGASRGPLTGILGFIITPLLTVTLSLTIPLMLERRLDVANAINEVGRIIFSRDALMWWIVGLVFSTISVAGLAGCGIGIFVTLPWIISSGAVAYRDVFGIDDPNRTLH